MKLHYKGFLHLLLIVGITVIACALTPEAPLPTLAPTLAPQAAATVAATPSAAASTELTPGINIAHWIEDQVKAGKFTREQGLIAALQIAVGEKPVISLQTTGSKFEGGSDLIRLARDYVKTGRDAKTKAEIERLLSIIFPSNAILEKYSVKATSTLPESSPKLARLIPETTYQDVCTTFWLNGFPAGAAPAGNCLEYRAGNVGGSQYRIFYPTSWRQSRALEVVRAMSLLPQTEQALRDSLTTYTGLGTFKNVNVIFSGLVYQDAGVNAGTYTNVPTETEPCPLVLYAPIFQLPEAHFKQTIAHELFHCFQHWNFPAQTDIAGSNAEDWWVEGTAEYFSNVVYPTANYEYRFIRSFDSQSSTASVLQMDYENFLFFQFLAQVIQHQGILNLIRTLPTSGGETEQLAALSRYPQINVHFQSFALGYIDRSIRDTSGAAIPVNPNLGTPLNISAANANVGLVGASAFVIGRKVVRFATGKGFAIQVSPSDNRGRSTARTEESRSWGALPATIGCNDSNRNYIVAATTITPNDVHVVNAAITVPQENCQPTPTVVAGCLVGRWAVEPLSFARVSAEGMFSQAPDLRNSVSLSNANGNAEYQFAPDGKATLTLTKLTVRFKFSLAGDDSATIEVILNGNAAYNYTLGSPDAITMAETADSTVATMKMITTGGAIDLPPTDGISMPGNFKYQCSGSTLTITFALPGGGQSAPLVLQKIN